MSKSGNSPTDVCLELLTANASSPGLVAVSNKWLLKWLGLLLALAIPLLLFLCHHLAANRNGGQVHQMVEELGSILVFAGRPLPNHACTKLVFIQYRTNDAWGIYLQEIATGKRKMLDMLSTDTRREGVVYECHFAGENRPRSCGSKPATPRCLSSYQFWFLHQALSLGGKLATGRAETG